MRVFIIPTVLVMIVHTCTLWARQRGTSYDRGLDAVPWTQVSKTTTGGYVAVFNALTASGLLENVQAVRLDAATASVAGNRISLDNLRALSDTTDFDDYLAVDFILDIDSLRLVPTRLDVSPDIGVYYAKMALFSKDVTTGLVALAPQGWALGPDEMHAITVHATDTFAMHMEAGTVLSWRVAAPSDDYTLYVDGPDGSPAWSPSFCRKDSDWTWLAMPVFKTGDYTFRFLPETKAAMTLQFGFTNNNRTPLSTIASGTHLSPSLSGIGHEYAKYRMNLKAGDLVEVSMPADPDVWLYLLDSNGLAVKSVNGELYERVSSSGVYYLFVINTNFQEGTTYSGTVTISPDPDVRYYPVLQQIPDQSAEEGEFFSMVVSASRAEEFSTSGLPPEMSIDETSGVISGTPTVAGKFPITVWATNDFGRDRGDFLLTVQGREPTCAVPGTVPGENGGYLVTSDLWIRAVIQTLDGEEDAVFYKGGESTTDDGGTYIWGYFYAIAPCGVSGADLGDPVVDVRIWFDVSGRVDVSFFHVSTMNIDVYSDYPYDSSYDQQGQLTACDRFVRHEYF